MKSAQHGSIRNDLQNMYVWIYENGAKDLKSRANISGRFHLDDIKIKRKVSPFLFLYPFIFLSLPFFLYFLPLTWRGETEKSSEIKVK